MTQPVGDVAREVASCRHCSKGIERRGGWWRHTTTGQARCQPASPRNAQLATPAPGSITTP
jgi:hypothetical protein